MRLLHVGQLTWTSLASHELLETLLFNLIINEFTDQVREQTHFIQFLQLKLESILLISNVKFLCPTKNTLWKL